MSVTEKDVLEISKSIGKARENKASIEGEKKRVLKTLKSEYGIISLEKAKKEAEKIRKEVNSLDTEIYELSKEIEEEFEWD